MLKCAICRLQDGHRQFVARDLAYGGDAEYHYFECCGCGCIQLRDIPADLSTFYPQQYYSFQQSCTPRTSGLGYRLKCLRTQHLLQGGNIAGWMAAKLFGVPDYLRWFAHMNLTTGSRLLDVGCGNGELLAAFRSWGFTALHGIDPFITKGSAHDGLSVRRLALQEVDGSYDALIFNHSWEHIPDHQQLMREVVRVLNPQGWLVVRIPVAGTYAWRTYGTDWHALDAPRHVCLHTERSLELLAREYGFMMRETTFDSTARQFWGSEQNRRGIGMYSPQSLRNNPQATTFSKQQLRQWAIEARRLNREHQGDCAAFLLQRQ